MTTRTDRECRQGDNAALVSDRLSLFRRYMNAPCAQRFAAVPLELMREQGRVSREGNNDEVRDGAWDFSTTVETEAAQRRFCVEYAIGGAGETDVARDEEEPSSGRAGSAKLLRNCRRSTRSRDDRVTEEELRATEVVKSAGLARN